MTEQTLYERLGGVNAIAMVVDRFSGQESETQREPGLERLEQDGSIAGPQVHADALVMPAGWRTFQYTDQELDDAHAHLHISSEKFDEVWAEIAAALDHFKVPEREKQEVLAAIVAHKPEVVGAR